VKRRTAAIRSSSVGAGVVMDRRSEGGSDQCQSNG
jgi:hypothetical protein